jgi:hypothetical protein
LKKDVSLLGFRDPATIVPIRFEADIMDNFWTLAPKPLRKLSRLAPSFGLFRDYGPKKNEFREV